MKPVAQALNILQGENNDTNGYIGYLAPTISLLKEKLAKKRSVPNCEPLVNALLSGIGKRFQSIFHDEKIIAAAILHPKFKDQWTEDDNILDRGIDVISLCEIFVTYTAFSICNSYVSICRYELNQFKTGKH